MRATHRGPVRLSGRPAARSRRSRSVRTGERSRPSPRAGMATIWDLESRSLRQGPFQVTSYAVGVSISADGTMLATAGGTACSSGTSRPAPRSAASETAATPAMSPSARPSPSSRSSSTGTSSGGRRRRDLGCGSPVARHDAAHRRGRCHRLGRRLQSGRPHARDRRQRPARASLGRPHRQAHPRARAERGQCCVGARVQPRRPDCSPSPAATPSRPSGTLPRERRSARGSGPAAASRCSTCPRTDAVC